ncbi:MAG: sugar transferase [Sphaerochaeta sp.]
MGYGSKRLVTVRMIGDSLAVILAWALAGYLRFYVIWGGVLPSFASFLNLYWLVWLFNIFFFSQQGLYKDSIDQSWRKETTDLLLASFKAFLLLLVVLYFLYDYKVSRVAIGLYYLLVVVFLIFERTLVSLYISKAYQKGKFTRSILLVGYGRRLAMYEEALHAKTIQGIKIVGQYDGANGPIEDATQLEGESLRAVVEATKPDLIVIGYPGEDQKRQDHLIAEGLDLLTERVVVLPQIPESYVGTTISDFKWIPQLSLNAAEIGVFERMTKRVFDFVASLFAVIILSPLLLVLAILVKLSSSGPVIFKQKRVTQNEKIFTMYKFRSMRSDIPEGDKARWTVEDDPRVTRIGSFMRKTSLDELPQLFNVLGGSMSLVGPRPERPELVEEFNTTIPGYRLRHRFKAGVSGWAQVNGWRGNTSLERRIEFDLYYIRNFSLYFDMKIVLFTFVRGFINENAY